MKNTLVIKLYQWVSLRRAAAFLKLSEDTIGRRAVPWPRDNQQVPGKIRYKILDLGSEKKPRRYTMEDLYALKQREIEKGGGGKN